MKIYLGGRFISKKKIKRAFEELAKEYEMIGDIRGRGVLIGVELVEDREKKVPANAALSQIFDYCEANGLIFQKRGSRQMLNVIRLVPPMTMTDKELDLGLSILASAIKAVSKTSTKGLRK